jgi:hypothetical protein
MAFHEVTISAKRTGTPEETRRFVWKLHVVIVSPTALEAADFIKGRFREFTAQQWRMLRRLHDVSLEIKTQRYRLISVKSNGRFMASKDEGAPTG